MKARIRFKNIDEKDSEYLGRYTYNLHFFDYLHKIFVNYAVEEKYLFKDKYFRFGKHGFLSRKNKEHHLKLKRINKDSPLEISVVFQGIIAHWALWQTLLFFSDSENQKKIARLFVVDEKNKLGFLEEVYEDDFNEIITDAESNFQMNNPYDKIIAELLEISIEDEDEDKKQ